MSQAAFQWHEARYATTPATEAEKRAHAAEIPPHLLAHLADFAAQQGISSDPWFAGLGITRQQVNDASLRISYWQARTAIARALRAIRHPALGLLLGRNASLGQCGLLGLAMRTARDFGEAVHVGVEHHRIADSLLDINVAAIDAHAVAVQAKSRFGDMELLPFLCEELFARWLVVARALVGSRLRPMRIDLAYPAPSYATEYTATFQCDVRFGAPHNRVVVAADWLSHPLPDHHPLTSRQALMLCHQQQRDGSRHDEIVGSVERLLRSRLGDHPKLTEVARTLHLSERSLRRKLAESGRIFRDIHDRVRAERALELLHAGRLSVAEIGIALGFSDPREFRRAFKRWTGMPPQLARHSLP